MTIAELELHLIDIWVEAGSMDDPDYYYAKELERLELQFNFQFIPQC